MIIANSFFYEVVAMQDAFCPVFLISYFHETILLLFHTTLSQALVVCFTEIWILRRLISSWRRGGPSPM